MLSALRSDSAVLNPRMIRYPNWLGAGLLALVGLSLALVWLDLSGYLGQELTFLGAKALIARYGPEPRLQAIGSVFPPVLLYAAAVVGSPLILQALLGAFLVGLLIRQIGNVAVAWPWQWLWTTLIVLHPAFGLMLLRSPSGILTTILLILNMSFLLALTKLDRFKDSSSSVFLLILLGLGLAPLMLTCYEAWFSLPLIVVILGVLFRRETREFKFSVSFVTLLMSLVFIGAWLYLNWLSTGDATYFLNSLDSGLRLPGLESFWQRQGFWGSWLQSLLWIISIVPAYLLVSSGVFANKDQWHSVALVSMLPIVLLVAAFWQGHFLPELSRFGIFLGVLPLILQYAQPSRLWQRSALTVVLVISLLAGGAFLQKNQATPEETLLWQRLTQQVLPSFSSTQQWLDQELEQRQVAKVLSEILQPGQRVLMDDAVNFQIVYLVNDSRCFILPYQFEFGPALQNPAQLVDFVLVSSERSPFIDRDRVLSYWKSLASGEGRSRALAISGFKQVLETPNYQLLKRIAPL